MPDVIPDRWFDLPFINQSRGWTLENEGRFDRDRLPGIRVDVEPDLTRGCLARGLGLAACLGAFDDDCTGRLEAGLEQLIGYARSIILKHSGDYTIDNRMIVPVPTVRSTHFPPDDRSLRLRLPNHGMNPTEIAEVVELPAGLARHWSVRSYYGTVSHNVNATYTRYLGWYDGNPANLEPLPPVDAARKYVDFMGGADAVLTKARSSFATGEYRWMAEVVGHVVFADPSNQAGRQRRGR